MSRHPILLPNRDLSLVVGWDAPLRHFFGQVYDKAGDCVWECEAASVDDLASRVEAAPLLAGASVTSGASWGLVTDALRRDAGQADPWRGRRPIDELRRRNPDDPALAEGVFEP